MLACLKQGKVRLHLPVCPFDTGMRLPGVSIIEAPRSVQGGGVPLMSTRVTPAVCTAERE